MFTSKHWSGCVNGLVIKPLITIFSKKLVQIKRFLQVAEKAASVYR